MKKFKQRLTVAMMSIGICTTLSVFLYLTLGRGSFNFIQPFTMMLSDPIYNATLSILIYAIFGVSVFTAINLFKDQNTSTQRQHKNIIRHFLISTMTFALLGFLTSFPVGTPLNHVWAYYYASGLTITNTIVNILLIPVVESLVIYLLVYLGLWLFYRHQIKQLNQIIKSNN